MTSLLKQFIVILLCDPEVAGSIPTPSLGAIYILIYMLLFVYRFIKKNVGSTVGCYLKHDGVWTLKILNIY